MSKRERVVDRAIADVKRRQLYEIDGVWITQKELDTIDSIENLHLEQVAFSLLCIAKLNILRKPNSNGWVGTDSKDIFRMAHVDKRAKDRDIMLGKLGERGLLEFPVNNNNESNRVTYIDDDSEKVLYITDFRELGYEYLQYRNTKYIKRDRFTRCKECGILMKAKGKNHKYCEKCRPEVPVKEFRQLICRDCGKFVVVSTKNKKSVRCPACQARYRKQRKLETQRQRRANQKTEAKNDPF